MPIHHVSLAAEQSEFESICKFYTRILEPLRYTVTFQEGFTIGFTGSDGTSDFGIHATSSASDVFERNKSKTHVAFQAEGIDAVNEWYRVAIDTSKQALLAYPEIGHVPPTPGETDLPPELDQPCPFGKVFGFVSGADDERAHQTTVTVSENMLAKIPPNIPSQVAVTIPESFVTAFNYLNNDFGLQLPWPRPENYRPSHSGALLLVWGAASLVGKHALQLMRYYHFCNRFAVAPKKNHELLKSIGSSAVFDSADADLFRQLLMATLKLNGGSCSPGRFIIDCWASQEASIQGISALANPGAKASFALPAVGRSNGRDYRIFSYPLLAADWRMGVQDKFLEEHLQPTIMADMVGRGVIKPGQYSIAEGVTLLKRAQKALNMVKIGGIDGKQVVWGVSED
ncbi:hypothetical protein FDECE_4478 [Fusarium decemcellulare]|nr:hypothetical protein FDECE_4478 [Fusarium decemcellulare]